MCNIHPELIINNISSFTSVSGTFRYNIPWYIINIKIYVNHIPNWRGIISPKIGIVLTQLHLVYGWIHELRKLKYKNRYIQTLEPPIVYIVNRLSYRWIDPIYDLIHVKSGQMGYHFNLYVPTKVYTFTCVIL